MRRAAALLVVAAVATGCGSSHAGQILSRTAGNLGKIRSGDLTLRLVVSPRQGTKGRVGFELRGPFALRPGGLPVAKVAYTQIAGSRAATATFISTGTKAYAEVNGKAYELPPASTAIVRQAAAGIGGSNGLGQFDISSWVRSPVASDGGEVGGARTGSTSSTRRTASSASSGNSAAGLRTSRETKPSVSSTRSGHPASTSGRGGTTTCSGGSS